VYELNGAVGLEKKSKSHVRRYATHLKEYVSSKYGNISLERCGSDND